LGELELELDDELEMRKTRSSLLVLKDEEPGAPHSLTSLLHYPTTIQTPENRLRGKRRKKRWNNKKKKDVEI
jgi:hypothetical protein